MAEGLSIKAGQAQVGHHRYYNSGGKVIYDQLKNEDAKQDTAGFTKVDS